MSLGGFLLQLAAYSGLFLWQVGHSLMLFSPLNALPRIGLEQCGQKNGDDFIIFYWAV